MTYLQSPHNNQLNHSQRNHLSLTCSAPIKTTILTNNKPQTISFSMHLSSSPCKNRQLTSLVQNLAPTINKTTSLITKQQQITTISLRCHLLLVRFQTCLVLRWLNTTSKKTCLICSVTESFVFLNT